MSANILGALLFMVILGVGDALILLVLSRAGVKSARVEGTNASISLRQLFPVIIVLSLIAGAIAGWFAGPIVLDAAGVEL